MLPSVPRTMRSSGQETRTATATGQSAPWSGVSSATIRSSAWIARWIARVAPVAPNTARVSLAGIAEARPPTRVSTRLCARPGTVSSRCSAAAAAAKAGTPGVRVKGIPCLRSRLICSATAL
jgi:hypothetical protein